MRYKLLIIAVLGTLIGYWVVNSFIQPMGFLRYMVIEFVISILHALYNYAKKEAANT